MLQDINIQFVTLVIPNICDEKPQVQLHGCIHLAFIELCFIHMQQRRASKS